MSLESVIDPHLPIPGGFIDPPGGTVRHTSKLAIWSLVLGGVGLPFLMCACPLPSVAAIVVGLVACVAIGRNPSLKGRGMAIGGIVCGLAGCALLVGVTVFAWDKIFKPIFEMPLRVSDAIAARDVDGFRECFAPPGSTADDAVVLAFFDEVHSTFGVPTHAALAEDSQSMTPPEPGSQFAMPWAFNFSGTSVPSHAELELLDERTGEWTVRLVAFELIGPDGKRFRYPSAPSPPVGAGTPEDAVPAAGADQLP